MQAGRQYEYVGRGVGFRQFALIQEARQVYVGHAQPRNCLLAGVVALAAAAVMMGQVTAIWQLYVANALLALGAVPSMTVSPEEVGTFVAHADALLINLGTLDAEGRTACEIAIEAAGKAGIRPVVGTELDMTVIGAALGIPLDLGGLGLWAFCAYDAYRTARQRMRPPPDQAAAG